MLAMETPVPTPIGWSSIGSLSVGDEIFDEAGQTCRVVALHPIDPSPISYRLTFDDGAQIDACADHLWLTFDAKELGQLTKLNDDWRARRRQRRPSRALVNAKKPWVQKTLDVRNRTREYEYKTPPAGTIRKTSEIAETLITPLGRRNHAIPVAQPLVLPDVYLPIDPYVLGAWLGDGNSHFSSITCHDQEILDHIAAAGHIISPRAEVGAFGINGGLRRALHSLGLIANKHIPAPYLRASIDQRLGLLQGLMDTDGTVADSGAVELTTTSEAIRDGAIELLRSLGIKAGYYEGRATLYGKDCGPKYRIKFMTSLPMFRLRRKAERQGKATRRTTAFRYVVACGRIDPKPMRCITVDSPSRLYLAGRSMIPTHNTDAILGIAITQHQRSIIFRREYPQLKGIRDRAQEILEDCGSFNGSSQTWRLNDGRMIEFGAVQYEHDVRKYQGRPHDYLAFDEVAHFSLSMFRFLIGWNRSTSPGQRVRIVCAGNPPTTAEGDWVIPFWGPWLDPQHPNPARPGELRWYATLDGRDVECVDGNPFEHTSASGVTETVRPLSRTFIPARVQDNPYLMASNYVATLQGLPEPLRSKMLYGDFTAGREDDAQQVIPTAWIHAAQERWTPYPPSPIDAIGVDVARGGKDKTVVVRRYGNWLDQIYSYEGQDTPSGQMALTYLISAIPPGTRPSLNIDVIGPGASVYDLATQSGLNAVAMQSSERSEARDRSGVLGFLNKRAEWWWKLREALDPETGDNIALPRDRELLADLTAPRWRMRINGIQVEDKAEISKRIGRSPDCGDACVYAFAVNNPMAYRSSLDWVA